jgi:hypothetical protein
MTPVERMARAIWREREIGFPPRVRRWEPDDFDRESGAWAACMREARAALASLREPSPQMVEAGNAVIEPDARFFYKRVADDVFEAMVDAALAERPTPSAPAAPSGSATPSTSTSDGR